MFNEMRAENGIELHPLEAGKICLEIFQLIPIVSGNWDPISKDTAYIATSGRR